MSSTNRNILSDKNDKNYCLIRYTVKNNIESDSNLSKNIYKNDVCLNNHFLFENY